jgi:hypothetical protein
MAASPEENQKHQPFHKKLVRLLDFLDFFGPFGFFAKKKLAEKRNQS